MSTPHATISAWERDEHDGAYQAELYDWALCVRWAPRDHENRGSFVWQAEREGHKHDGHHGFTEMELAMADAERFAREDARRRAFELAGD